MNPAIEIGGRFDASHFRGADGFAKDDTLARRQAAGFAFDVAAGPNPRAFKTAMLLEPISKFPTAVDPL